MFTEAVGHQPVLPSPRAARLFTPWRCRGVQARNRVVISPMQQYSAQDGLANDWHLMHLGRFALDVATSVRRHWPEHLPLAWRVSLADLDQGDLSHEELLALCAGLRERGVDLVDASSAGGIGSYPTRLQTRRSDLDFRADDGALLRREAGVSVIAVGNIVTPEQAEALVRDGCADLVAIGREALYNPNWALHAERALGLDNGMAHWPRQHRMWLARRATSANAVRDAATLERLRARPVHGETRVPG